MSDGDFTCHNCGTRQPKPPETEWAAVGDSLWYLRCGACRHLSIVRAIACLPGEIVSIETGERFAEAQRAASRLRSLRSLGAPDAGAAHGRL